MFIRRVDIYLQNWVPSNYRFRERDILELEQRLFSLLSHEKILFMNDSLIFDLSIPCIKPSVYNYIFSSETKDTNLQLDHWNMPLHLLFIFKKHLTKMRWAIFWYQIHQFIFVEVASLIDLVLNIESKMMKIVFFDFMEIRFE